MLFSPFSLMSRHFVHGILPRGHRLLRHFSILSSRYCVLFWYLSFRGYNTWSVDWLFLERDTLLHLFLAVILLGSHYVGTFMLQSCYYVPPSLRSRPAVARTPPSGLWMLWSIGECLLKYRTYNYLNSMYFIVAQLEQEFQINNNALKNILGLYMTRSPQATFLHRSYMLLQILVIIFCDFLRLPFLGLVVCLSGCICAWVFLNGKPFAIS